MLFWTKRQGTILFQLQLISNGQYVTHNCSDFAEYKEIEINTTHNKKLYCFSYIHKKHVSQFNLTFQGFIQLCIKEGE